MDFIDLIEKNLGAHAKKFLPMQDGDVYKTFADVTNLKNEIDYVPTTNLESGIEKFINWYKNIICNE